MANSQSPTLNRTFKAIWKNCRRTIKRTHSYPPAAALLQKHHHYRALAEDLALDLLLNPERPDAAQTHRLARDHSIRAETFRTAATMIAGYPTR